ncbi:hypothetical protein NC651_025375 [Populus alba x Populus x berolinensis]|nr:hypothetical protein NC651_025375 [Populus alba x Populus x berolinensis]
MLHLSQLTSFNDQAPLKERTNGATELKTGRSVIRKPGNKSICQVIGWFKLRLFKLSSTCHFIHEIKLGHETRTRVEVCLNPEISTKSKLYITSRILEFKMLLYGFYSLKISMIDLAACINLQ